MRYSVWLVLLLLLFSSVLLPLFPLDHSPDSDCSDLVPELRSLLTSYELHTANLKQSLSSQNVKIENLLERSRTLEAGLSEALQRAENSENTSVELQLTIVQLKRALEDSRKQINNLESLLRKSKLKRIKAAAISLICGILIGIVFF